MWNGNRTVRQQRGRQRQVTHQVQGPAWARPKRVAAALTPRPAHSRPAAAVVARQAPRRWRVQEVGGLAAGELLQWALRPLAQQQKQQRRHLKQGRSTGVRRGAVAAWRLLGPEEQWQLAGGEVAMPHRPAGVAKVPGGGPAARAGPQGRRQPRRRVQVAGAPGPPWEGMGWARPWRRAGRPGPWRRAGRPRPWRRREPPKQSASRLPQEPQGLLMLTPLAPPQQGLRAEQTPEALPVTQVRLCQQKRLWVPQRARRPSQQLQGLVRQRKQLAA